MSPLRTGRLLFDASPARGALPFAASATQSGPVAAVHSMLDAPALADVPPSSRKPLARPSSVVPGTNRAKSLHSHPVRSSQHARLRPVVHLKASSGNPVACPKPRPVPSARGAYAGYSSLSAPSGSQAEGSFSKSVAHLSRPSARLNHQVHCGQGLGSQFRMLRHINDRLHSFPPPARGPPAKLSSMLTFIRSIGPVHCSFGASFVSLPRLARSYSRTF